MTDRNASCEERIGDELKDRIDSLRELYTRADSDDDTKREEAIEEIDNYALSVDIRRTMVVCISTGGPGDQFECDIDANDEIETIRYRFLDWFDGAVRTLDGEEEEIARRFCEPFAEMLVTS